MARGRPSKKQHIIDTALNLFSRLGYQGTSIDQVVAAAAVSKPTVYSNFSSKQVLWVQSLEKILSLSEEDVQAVLDKQQAHLAHNEATVECVLTHWLDIWQSWLASDDRLCVYRIMIGESHKMEADSIALFQQLEATLLAALTSVIAPLSLTEEQKAVLFSVSRERLLWSRLYKGADPSAPLFTTVAEFGTDINTILAKLMTS
ncbi:TetR/AcrR family transcriptional regulator [Marinomonas agarivorans]|nr:TetR/AcrR family transcriptional regulator [Marinomonas agarivorans]